MPPEGRGRPQRLRYTDGQITVTDSGFFDPVIDARCDSIELDDGTIRCLPITGLTIDARFSDNRCEVPLHVASVRTGVCGDLPVPKFASLDSAPGCTNTSANKPHYEVRRVLGVYPGTVYEGTGPTDCTSLTGVTSYQLGEPVPLDQFATATLTTDP